MDFQNTPLPSLVHTLNKYLLQSLVLLWPLWKLTQEQMWVNQLTFNAVLQVEKPGVSYRGSLRPSWHPPGSPVLSLSFSESALRAAYRHHVPLFRELLN